MAGKGKGKGKVVAYMHDASATEKQVGELNLKALEVTGCATTATPNYNKTWPKEMVEKVRAARLNGATWYELVPMTGHGAEAIYDMMKVQCRQGYHTKGHCKYDPCELHAKTRNPAKQYSEKTAGQLITLQKAVNSDLALERRGNSKFIPLGKNGKPLPSVAESVAEKHAETMKRYAELGVDKGHGKGKGKEKGKGK